MHYLTWRFLYFENYGDGSKAQVCKLGPMYAAAGAWFQVSKKKNLKMEMILEMFHLQMTRSNWYGRTQWRHRRSQLYSWLSGAAFPTFHDKFIVCIIRPFVCLFYSEIVLVYGNWLDQVLSKRLKFFNFNIKCLKCFKCFNRINEQLFKAMTLLSRKRFLSGWENPLNLLVGFVRRRKTLNGRLIFFLEDASSRAECIDQSSTEMTLTADKICSFPLDKKKTLKAPSADTCN